MVTDQFPAVRHLQESVVRGQRNQGARFHGGNRLHNGESFPGAASSNLRGKSPVAGGNHMVVVLEADIPFVMVVVHGHSISGVPHAEFFPSTHPFLRRHVPAVHHDPPV